MRRGLSTRASTRNVSSSLSKLTIELLKSSNDPMNICQQCGSASRDISGFCAGCRAPWPLASPDHAANHAGSRHSSPYANLPAKISSAGLVEIRPKTVWAAVMYALLFGPMGLLYCTTTGTVVMTIVSIPLMLLFGRVSSLIILPICAIWAWRAARESTSLFD